MANEEQPPAPLAQRTEKPPMALKPRGAWIEARKIEILQAIRRYSDRGMAVPVDWIDELAELLDVDLRRR